MIRKEVHFMGLRYLPKPLKQARGTEEARCTVPPDSTKYNRARFPSRPVLPPKVGVFPRPGRPCETCRHRERKNIDLALIGGESSRSVAARFGLSPSSVKRHRAGCVPATLVLARRSETIAEAEFLLARAAELDRRALRIFEVASLTADLGSAIAALGEQRRLLSLQARMVSNGAVARNMDQKSPENLL